MMENIYFEFKQFRVRHDRCAMKIGTDGVMLGAWCDVGQATAILDIGTGTGIIALLAAQRSNARIIGIDIDREAVEQACENAMNSPWPDRISIFNYDALSCSCMFSEHSFDLIVSNPPFYENALDSTDKRRNSARNESSLPFESLIDTVTTLLHVKGRFNVILPYVSAERFIYNCWERGLYLYRRTNVYTKSGKKASRVMLGFSFQKQSPEETVLFIRKSDGTLTPEYIALVGDYYVKL